MKKTLLIFGIISMSSLGFGQGNGNGSQNSNANTQWKTNGNIADSSHFIGTKNDSPVKFRSNDIERFRITPEGNIGIGTSTPEAKLHVNGSTKIEGVLQLPNTNIISANDLTNGNFDFLLLNLNGDASKGSYDTLVFNLKKDLYKPYPPNKCDDNVVFQNPTWASGPNKIYSLCPQVRIGIGTHAPEFKLDVKGIGAFSSIKIGKAYSPNLSAHIEGLTNPGSFLHPWIRFTVEENNVKNTVFLVNNDGGLYCTSARVRLKEDIPVPDFVFQPDYELMPLNEVKTYVQMHSHLPGIPSEAEIRAEGLNLEEMQLKLLQKVEELTLYVIELDEKNKVLEAELETLKTAQK